MALSSTRLKNDIRTRVEAIADFPQPGKSPQMLDDRVLQAFCDAIVAEITGHADVVPASHSGENLSAPAGQPLTIPDTSNPHTPSVGTTDSDVEVVGKGSIQ